jgi:DNA-directed RNA polymerase specialized sigma24 family protein
MAAEELVESVIAVLYQRILSSDEPFWEVRFWICYERRLLTELSRYRAMVGRHNQLADSNRILEDSLVEPSGTRAEWKDPAFRVVVSEGLAQLPDPLRTAFMLKHWAGFPECSVDPAEQATIAKVMGVTDRTVRNYLARAEQILNAWRRENREVSTREGAMT